MSFFKYICKKFSCKSSCMYNNKEPCVIPLNDINLKDYNLTLKDLILINEIITNRSKKERLTIIETLI